MDGLLGGSLLDRLVGVPVLGGLLGGSVLNRSVGASVQNG